MNFIRTIIADVVIIEPKVHGDDRGYFVETFMCIQVWDYFIVFIFISNLSTFINFIIV